MRRELARADIVLPSLDAVTEEGFKAIDRPMGSISFAAMSEGLKTFSREYEGQLWMEIMLVAGMNDSEADLYAFRDFLKEVDYDRIYINTPVRPPAEGFVHTSSPETIARAVEILGGISIDQLTSGSFFSEISDPYEAVLSIARRHPMNAFEVDGFLESRGMPLPERQALLERLGADPAVETVTYKGLVSYRIR